MIRDSGPLFWYPGGMKPRQQAPRSIDVTGLSEEAIWVVESLVSQLRSQDQPAAPPGGPGTFSSYEEWKSQFDAWMQEVAARADRYPPGFVVDDSREAIYGDDRDA